MTPSKHTGRRPGESGTRDVIAVAARRQFADHGYDRTSMRSVAKEAGVDPALVSHFFGSKQELFTSVVELPFEPDVFLPAILDGERSEAGERLIRLVLAMLDQPEAGARFLAVIRSASSEPEAARLLREMVTARLMGPIAEGLGGDDAPLRAALAGSQIVGLVMARGVVGIKALSEADTEVLVAALAPTFQRYLADPLS
jgi:AcrR family transcriptional regulator